MCCVNEGGTESEGLLQPPLPSQTLTAPPVGSAVTALSPRSAEAGEGLPSAAPDNGLKEATEPRHSGLCAREATGKPHGALKPLSSGQSVKCDISTPR